MIYTVTFNPAIDYVVRTEEMKVASLIGLKAKRYISEGKD